MWSPVTGNWPRTYESLSQKDNRRFFNNHWLCGFCIQHTECLVLVVIVVRTHCYYIMLLFYNLHMYVHRELIRHSKLKSIYKFVMHDLFNGDGGLKWVLTELGINWSIIESSYHHHVTHRKTYIWTKYNGTSIAISRYAWQSKFKKWNLTFFFVTIHVSTYRVTLTSTYIVCRRVCISRMPRW